VKYYFYLGGLIFLFLSCQNKRTKNGSSIAIKQLASKKDAARNQPKPDEFFVDSLNVGRKSLNKIELSKYCLADSCNVVIRFYSKQKDGWKLKNEFRFPKDNVAACDTKLADFNNDGLNDLTYVSDIAARGANEIRRLFIYDKTGDKLIDIKNSDNYPNLLYNKDLHCLDAFLVYGGCSTVFLKLDTDTLRQFASVELFHGLTISTYDKKGKERVVLHDTTNHEQSIRYKNYQPLMEADDH
jgi:hypothetical protein